MKFFGRVEKFSKLIFSDAASASTAEVTYLGPTNSGSFQLKEVASPSATHIILTEDQVQTITGKTISGLVNTIEDLNIDGLFVDNILDADKVFLRDASGVALFSRINDINISDMAAISRSKIAVGTVSHVVVNDGVTGELSSTEFISAAQGGTGVANSGTLTFNNNLQFSTAADSTLTVPGTGTLVTLDATQELENKTIDGSKNTFLNLPFSGFFPDILADAYKVFLRDVNGAVTFAKITNDNIDSAAAIARSKVAAGTADHVVINAADGSLSSEAALDSSRGGTGYSNTGKLKTSFDIEFVATGNVILTLPASGTVVTLDATQTLTNKTLVSPKLSTDVNSPTIEVFSQDPDVTPQAGNAGSLAFSLASGRVFIKKDAGTSTNWTIIDTSEYTRELTGVAPGSSFTVSFDHTTRDLTLSFTSTIIFTAGRRNVFTSQNVVIPIPNVTGSYYIYLSNGASPTWAASPTIPNLADGNALCSLLYFNTDFPADYFLYNERHGIIMDGQTHNYLHNTRGAAWASGFTLSGFVLNSSALANVQIAIASGVFFDEDNRLSLAEKLEADAFAKIYRTGATGSWRRGVADSIPSLYSGIVPQINTFNGVDWVLSPVTNNSFFNYFLFATNAEASADRFILIPGQAQFSSVANATAGENINNLSLGAIPSPEFLPIARITMRYSTANTGNTARVDIRQVTDLRTQLSPGVASGASTNHNSLSGRDAASCHPSSSIDAPAGLTDILLGQTTVAGCLTALDTHGHPLADISDLNSDYTIGGVKTWSGKQIQTGSESISLLASQTNTTLRTYSNAVAVTLDYYLTRDGHSEVGTFRAVRYAGVVGFNTEQASTGNTGIDLTAIDGSSNIVIRYSSPSGATATIKIFRETIIL